jgi:hypothetical protein
MPTGSWAAIEPRPSCAGTTHKTVRRVVERGASGPAERPVRPHNTDAVKDLIADATMPRRRVDHTHEGGARRR